MIVWVDDRLFQEGARDVDRLALLRGASSRRHTLIVSARPADSRHDRHSPGFDRWTAGLPEQLRREVHVLRERLDLVSGNAAARGAKRLLVSEHTPQPAAPGCWVTMDEAVRAVILPTYILVENAINDRAFLRCAMPPLWRERLDTWERGGLLRYENGGGNSVMTLLLDFHASDENARQAFGLPTELWRLVHVIVYDHDGTSMGQPGEGARQLAEACKRPGLEHRGHRLERRDQEHYLPAEALRAIVNVRVTNNEQRTALMNAVATHMAKGADRHFSELPRLGDSPFFKNEFGAPLMWTAESVEWFQRDGAWPEMTLLAEKIAAAI